MSVVRLKRNESPYEVVNTASKIFKLMLKICLKMPKRYTYLVLQDLIKSAGQTADFTRGAKSFDPVNTKQAQTQMTYFIHAGAALDALSGKLNIFLEIPESLTYRDEKKKTKGVTLNELEELATYIKTQRNLIEQEIDKIRKRFPNLIENEKVRQLFTTQSK